MDPQLPTPQKTDPPSHPPLPGPRPRRKPAGRKALPGIDGPLTAQGLVRTVRSAFPHLNDWLNGLPDPRCQAMCLYSAAHLWWQILATFLSRSGSRNAFDQQRQSGQAPWNLGQLCGQTAEDPRFAGQPSVTSSDNAAYHASRVDPELVAQIPIQ